MRSFCCAVSVCREDKTNLDALQKQNYYYYYYDYYYYYYYYYCCYYYYYYYYYCWVEMGVRWGRVARVGSSGVRQVGLWVRG